jgi:predicted metal-binding protein
MPITDENNLLESIRALEPTGLAVAKVSDFTFNPIYRSFCEANRCGHFRKNWKCPPFAGEVEDLINEAKEYDRAVVYQVIGQLKHSLDWKGTVAAGKIFNSISFQIIENLLPQLDKALVLGSGPCQLCDKCAKRTDEACRHPEKAFRSMEANCIDVNALAGVCGMKYINGPNTVTFFGTLLHNLPAQ